MLVKPSLCISLVRICGELGKAASHRWETRGEVAQEVSAEPIAEASVFTYCVDGRRVLKSVAQSIYLWKIASLQDMSVVLGQIRSGSNPLWISR